MPSTRFSGHESFSLRFGWLPKVFAFTSQSPQDWRDEGRAMVGLGLGKNMVVSLRFWAESLGILEGQDGGLVISSFGRRLLDTKNGWDPYLERKPTLWALHWRLVHPIGGPLFAWKVMFGQWVHREWTRTSVLEEFNRLAALESSRSISPVTLSQHFDIFLRTYLPPLSRGKKRAEDELDCPLAELRLVDRLGERRVGRSARAESVYSFRHGAKPDLSDAVFVAALTEYWATHRAFEKTLAFRDVASAPLSIGRVFCLSEEDVRDRLERIEKISRGLFDFRPSGLVDAVHVRGTMNPPLLWAHALAGSTRGLN
jgi:hypothetical protein